MIKYILLIILLSNCLIYSQKKDSVKYSNINITVDSTSKLVDTKFNSDSIRNKEQFDSINKLLFELLQKNEIQNKDSWVPFWAYIAAGVISLVVALLTIRANVISRARIKWIQDVRDTMSDFLSLSESVTEYKKKQHLDERKKDLHISTISRMLSKESKLKLLLNNKKEDAQTNLIESIESYSNELNDINKAANEKRLESIKKECISKTQDLLKKEWNFAKKESYWILVFRKKSI